MIALDRVSYYHAGRPLVHDVTHILAPGDVTVLLGANGAGKSSLIRLMSGEWKPARGTVTWNGESPVDRSRQFAARHRAVVSQHGASMFSFRVIDLVSLGRIPHNRQPDVIDYDIAMEALDLVGMASMANRSMTTLSGGERQRVHLARALAQLHEARLAQSGVLLLDEPTAHLDLAHQHKTLLLARRLASEGLAVLSVLHDLNLAATYADRVMLMHHGRLMAAGSIENVLTDSLLREVFEMEFTQFKQLSGRPYFVPVSPEMLYQTKES